MASENERSSLKSRNQAWNWSEIICEVNSRNQFKQWDSEMRGSVIEMKEIPSSSSDEGETKGWFNDLKSSLKKI